MFLRRAGSRGRGRDVRGDGRDVALGEGGVVELREETHPLDGGLRRSDRFGIFDIQLSGVGKEDAFPLCFARTAGGHGMVAELFFAVS